MVQCCRNKCDSLCAIQQYSKSIHSGWFCCNSKFDQSIDDISCYVSTHRISPDDILLLLILLMYKSKSHITNPGCDFAEFFIGRRPGYSRKYILGIPASTEVIHDMCMLPLAILPVVYGCGCTDPLPVELRMEAAGHLFPVPVSLGNQW